MMAFQSFTCASTYPCRPSSFSHRGRRHPLSRETGFETARFSFWPAPLFSPAAPAQWWREVDSPVPVAESECCERPIAAAGEHSPLGDGYSPALEVRMEENLNRCKSSVYHAIQAEPTSDTESLTAPVGRQTFGLRRIRFLPVLDLRSCHASIITLKAGSVPRLPGFGCPPRLNPNHGRGFEAHVSDDATSIGCAAAAIFRIFTRSGTDSNFRHGNHRILSR